MHPTLTRLIFALGLSILLWASPPVAAMRVMVCPLLFWFESGCLTPSDEITSVTTLVVVPVCYVSLEILFQLSFQQASLDLTEVFCVSTLADLPRWI